MRIWSVSEGNTTLFIGFKILAKFSYQADNSKNEHLSADTDMVADISCIPKILMEKISLVLK